jgi:uncharacterized membrane protein YtjA (UPF0391 family)
LRTPFPVSAQDNWGLAGIRKLPPRRYSEDIITFGGVKMLRWALIFFVIAIVAAIFGFTGIYAAASGIARILFVLFLILFIISLVTGYSGGRRRL